MLIGCFNPLRKGIAKEWYSLLDLGKSFQGFFDCPAVEHPPQGKPWSCCDKFLFFFFPRKFWSKSMISELSTAHLMSFVLLRTSVLKTGALRNWTFVWYRLEGMFQFNCFRYPWSTCQGQTSLLREKRHEICEISPVNRHIQGHFHAQFQEKMSRQHFCKPCEDDIWLPGKMRSWLSAWCAWNESWLQEPLGIWI